MVSLDCGVSKGLPVYFAELPRYCADGRTIVMTVHRGAAVNLNSEVWEHGRLEDRLREVYRTRAERLLFVRGDSDVDVVEVAQAIDIARTQIEYVVLLTPSIEKGIRERPFCCCLGVHLRSGTSNR